MMHSSCSLRATGLRRQARGVRDRSARSHRRRDDEDEEDEEDEDERRDGDGCEEGKREARGLSRGRAGQDHREAGCRDETRQARLQAGPTGSRVVEEVGRLRVCRA